jgi:sirohydrochlorin cobaltochelatase
VVVVPFFISDGLHSYEDIPVMLGIHSKSLNGKSGNPHQVHGRSLFYSTAIGTDPKFADVIIEQAVSFDSQRQELESTS